MFFSFIYDALLVLSTLVFLPKWIFDAFFKKKYRSCWKERLGLKQYPLCRGNRHVVWFHAVSLGETKALGSLVRKFHRHHPDWSIIISSGTETGHAEAKRAFPFADKHIYLPIDFSWTMRKLVGQVRPSLVVLSEGDLWAHFLHYAKKWQAKVIVVNGKLSERSLKRMKWVPFFTRRILKNIDLVAAQSRVYADRWAELGFPGERIAVTGNLKFDDFDKEPSLVELQQWRRKLALRPQDLVVTLGSSHAPEEGEFLQQMQVVWKKFPEAKVIIVPRHPERFDEVERLIQKQGVPYRRYSRIGQNEGGEAKVILLDAMGMLRICYRLSHVAVVAGSYVPHVGGHNILEPCAYGVPVLFGPYMHKQPELVALAQEFQAGKEVAMDKIGSVVAVLLEQEALRKKIGACGKALMVQHQGATERTWKILEPIIAKII